MDSINLLIKPKKCKQNNQHLICKTTLGHERVRRVNKASDIYDIDEKITKQKVEKQGSSAFHTASYNFLSDWSNNIYFERLTDVSVGIDAAKGLCTKIKYFIFTFQTG